MDRNPDSALANPYASPAAAPDFSLLPAEPAAPRPGSLVIIILGFFLLLVGYAVSNALAIGDLYGLGMAPEGEKIPSPLAELCSTPFELWLFYAATAGATVAGCLLIGSQNANPMAIVCYVMCPIAGLVFLLGMPLRLAGRRGQSFATIYLGVGTCLAGDGILRLIHLYGQPGVTFEPILASLMTEAGLALAAGGLLKLVWMGTFSTPEPIAGTAELTAAGS
jgi:hypothetical protein